MNFRTTAIVTLVFTAQAIAAPDMCFEKAGRDYNIDPLLLTAIAIKESRLNPRAVNNTLNKDGSEDVCGMQINSSNYSKLERFSITRESLLSDPCICVYAGGWVLARNFRSYGKNWDSVGMYNAGPSKKNISARKAYAAEIKSIYTILLAKKSLQENRHAQ